MRYPVVRVKERALFPPRLDASPPWSREPSRE
jgi:hypothetical protein